MEIWGSNLLDLVSHVMCQRWPQPLMHRSPGPPPGFSKFGDEETSRRRPWPNGMGRRCWRVMTTRRVRMPIKLRTWPEPICLVGDGPVGLLWPHIIIIIIMPAAPERQGRRTSPPPHWTYVSTIAEWARRIAWPDSTSFGQAWGSDPLGRPSGKPWPLRKVTCCTAQCATVSLMADHRVQAGRPIAVGTGGMQWVLRGQWWHQVYFLLHRCICLGTTSEQQARHPRRQLPCRPFWMSCHWLCSHKDTEMCAVPFQRLLQSRDIHFFTSVNDIKCAMVECFQRTLQGMSHRHMTANRTHRFVDILLFHGCLRWVVGLGPLYRSATWSGWARPTASSPWATRATSPRRSFAWRPCETRAYAVCWRFIQALICPRLHNYAIKSTQLSHLSGVV